jgi:flagellin-like protein
MFRKLHAQNGITGLETAIILIAIVVVAAVTAYTILSAGLFATEKSRDAVYSSLQKVEGALIVKGGINACKDTLNSAGTGSVGRLVFSLAECTDGGQTDLSPAWTVDPGTGALVNSHPGANHLEISYHDRSVSVQDCAWTVEWVGKHDSNNVLDFGEKAVITVWLHAFDGLHWGPPGSESSPFLGRHYLDCGHPFSLELKSANGATLALQRTTPDFLFDVVSLK